MWHISLYALMPNRHWPDNTDKNESSLITERWSRGLPHEQSPSLDLKPLLLNSLHSNMATNNNPIPDDGLTLVYDACEDAQVESVII